MSIISGPSWTTEIAALFAAPYWIAGDPAGIGRQWAGCMGPYAVDLTSYDSVRTNAVLIYDALRSRWMPLGATPAQHWPDAALEQLRRWVNEGWRRAPGDPVVPAERIPPPSERPHALRIRRDLRALSAEELDDFRARLDDALRVGDPAPDAPGQQFFQIHGDWCLHYQEAFLPWHRAYLMQLERRIGCALPYWNWFAEDASIEGSPSAGLPQAFQDLTYVDPRTGERRPNPLRFAAAWKGMSKVCAAGPPPGVDCRYVQRDPVLYTHGDDHRAERTKKIALTALYQQQVARAMAFELFSQPQGAGHPWANIPSFDPPPPDGDYVYRDVNFDGAYEQPHDNYHGWVGGDMADNAYTAFDPVFWCYHANIDRMFELWLRAHPTVLFTALAALRPFTGARADAIELGDPRGFVYTTIGDLAKDCRGLGYDYAPPVDPDVAGPYARHEPAPGVPAAATAAAAASCPAHHVASVPAAAPASPARPVELELLVRFDGVRCTHDSYAIDAFLNLAAPTPDDVDAGHPHYIGRFSRLGMGLVDTHGRCITQGVTRLLDATAAARRVGVAPGEPARLTLLVTRLPSGEPVAPDELEALPGFTGSVDWYRDGRALRAPAAAPGPREASCCQAGRRTPTACSVP